MTSLGDFASIVASVRRAPSAQFFTVVFAATSLAFGGFALLPSPVRWVFVLAMLASFGLSVWFAIYSHLFRPAWLQTERQDTIKLVLELLDDDELTGRDRAEVVMRMLQSSSSEPVPKRQTRHSSSDLLGGEGDGDSA